MIFWLIVNNLNMCPKGVFHDTCVLPKKWSSHIYVYINLHRLIEVLVNLLFDMFIFFFLDNENIVHRMGIDQSPAFCL